MKYLKKITALTAAAAMLLCASPNVSAIDQSFIIGEEVGNTVRALSDFISQNALDGYATITPDHEKAEVVCCTAEQLEKVKEYSSHSGFDESLIIFTVDESLDLTATDGGKIRAAENDELEELVMTAQKLYSFVYDNGYADTSAYVSLKWYMQSVQLYVKDYQIYEQALKFIEENNINMVDVIVSPEYDFRMPDGGAKEGEINSIVAGEYFAVKSFMNENSYQSNIFLSNPSEYVTSIEVYVKTDEAADALNRYMDENYFWKDVVSITVTSDLSAAANENVRNKSFVVIEGDTNDDGVFAVSDVVMLQKNLLGAGALNERQIAASDMYRDDNLDVFDLCLQKRAIIKLSDAE